MFNDDLVVRARVLLLDVGRGREDVHWLPPADEVWAYRMLAPTSPTVYLPKLVRALGSRAHAPEFHHRPEVRLRLLGQAVAAAETLPDGLPERAELLTSALSAYLRHLPDGEEARTVRARLTELTGTAPDAPSV